MLVYLKPSWDPTLDIVNAHLLETILEPNISYYKCHKYLAQY